MTVGQINGKLLVGRVGLDKVLGTGLALTALAATSLLLMSAGVFGPVGLVPMAAGLFVLMASMGLVMPSTNTLALLRTLHAAGSASALLGTSTFLLGSVASRWWGSRASGPPCRWPSFSSAAPCWRS